MVSGFFFDLPTLPLEARCEVTSIDKSNKIYLTISKEQMTWHIKKITFLTSFSTDEKSSLNKNKKKIVFKFTI